MKLLSVEGSSVGLSAFSWAYAFTEKGDEEGEGAMMKEPERKCV